MKASKVKKLLAVTLALALISSNFSITAEAGLADLINGNGSLGQISYSGNSIKWEQCDINQAQITRIYNLGEYLGEHRESQLNYGNLSIGSCNYITNQYTDMIGNIHTDYCDSTDLNMTDSSLTASIQNTINTPTLLCNTNYFNQRQPYFKFNRPSLSGGAQQFNIDDYSFAIYRGSDKITLSEYEKAQGGADDKLLKLLDNRIGYTGSGRKDNGKYTEKLSIVLEKEQNTSNDYETSAERSCGHSGTVSNTSSVTSNPVADKDISIAVYKGNKVNGGSLTVGERNNLQLIVGGRSLSGVHGHGVKQHSVVGYYPWVRMFYHEFTTDNDSSRDIAYTTKQTTVLSEYIRGILPTSYAEAGYYKSKDENIELISNQWNVDKGNRKDSINSGSSLRVSTSGNETKLYISTYQFIIPDGKNREAIEAVSGNIYNEYSNATATSKHNNFVAEACKTLDNYRVVLWVNKSDSIKNVKQGGVKVSEPDTNISALQNGINKSSSEVKYYLSKDTPNQLASEGDIDSRIGATSTTYYKILSDTSGNVMLASSNNLSQLESQKTGRVILTKNQSISSLTDAEAKSIDERTKLITNYVNSIQRNKGMDKSPEVTWVSDGRWYNEAFELYLVHSITDIELGLVYPSNRELVIDPKLSPKNLGRSDNYSKWHSAVFSLNNRADGNNIAGYIGTFDNQVITLPSIEDLFKSRIFYIANVTSQEQT